MKQSVKATGSFRLEWKFSISLNHVNKQMCGASLLSATGPLNTKLYSNLAASARACKLVLQDLFNFPVGYTRGFDVDAFHTNKAL